MRNKIALYFSSFVLFGLLFVAANATAQTIAYRQANLSSNLPNVADHVVSGLVNPWGIAFLPGQPFFIADNKTGRVTSHDATGLFAAPGGFILDVAGTGFQTPTGIVADQNSSFADPSIVQPFISVTEQGSIFTWGPDARGDIPTAATLVANNASTGAVYKGVAILNSSLTAPALAVTDFHNGFIDTFLPGFAQVALPGSFTDPTLPAGYAPFGIQVIGRQVFVTYALQDPLKQNPIFGAGNGIVSIFDMDGNFVRRFASAGALNAPWGVTQASANFGPFSNDILIGNIGDGTISAFDPMSGQFVGQLLDGNGFALAEVGLHGLVFRADGFGDPNTLYFTSRFNNEDDGLFGAMTTGLVSMIRVSAPDPTASTSVTITANVAAGPGNPGTPTGTVSFLDGSNQLGTAPLLGGSATLDATFTGVGTHAITAQYSGDGVFLPSSERIPLQVTGLATMLTLIAPTNAAPNSPVTLTATITSAGGIPTGQIVFLDGTTGLGSAALDATGVAALGINSLATGVHSLTASYSGDDKFSATTSAAVTINIVHADFSVGAAPNTATVIAGQSTQFILTITPAGGFSNNVTFSCSPVTGISCTFNPPMVTPANGTASTTLTVTTSASVSRYGLLTLALIGPASLLSAFVLFAVVLRSGQNLRSARASLIAATAVLVIAGVSLTLGGCGGYGSTTKANRGTASVMVTAQSGAISHAATVVVTVQ